MAYVCEKHRHLEAQRIQQTISQSRFSHISQGSIDHNPIHGAREAQFRKYGISLDDLEKAYKEASAMDPKRCRTLLSYFLDDHYDDMLIPRDFYSAVQDLLSLLRLSDDKSTVDERLEDEARLVAAVYHSNSAYREVRATFSHTDDPSTPCGTVRAWVIGMVWAVGLAALNQFFAPRNPSTSLSPYLAQLLSYPMGCLCAAVLPRTVFLRGSKFEFTLNPGPFNIKEHMLITIMSNASAGSSLSSMFFQQNLPIFFGQSWAGSWAYQLCVTLSAQVFGFGLAGMTRRFLVYPSRMIYYFTLSQASLNSALHNQNNSYVHGWSLSRFNFFLVVSGAMFVYYWLPNTFMPVLTFFNWTTWIAPQNAILSIITGMSYSNLGLNLAVTSFDWNWFAGIDPLITPFFIVFQIVAACLVWAVCVVLPVFFTNTWNTGYLPINSWYTFDNTGQKYAASRIMASDGTFNQTAYEAYSPVFIPATFILRYAVMFATLPAVLTFTYLWYGNTLWMVFQNACARFASHTGFNDVHSRLMSKYPEVPETWYLAVGSVGAALGMGACLVFPTGTPWWTIPATLAMSVVVIIPVGVVMAVSGYETSLEIFMDVIGGHAVQNHPVSLTLFRELGLSIISQALSFITDMKLGHYVKVPPRQMFCAQVAAAVASSVAVVAVVQFQLTIDGMCDPAVNVHWVCGSAHAQYSSALLWGLIGPQRLFTHVSAPYWKVMLATVGGLFWPVPWYFARKAWPTSVLRYVHPIVLLMGGIMWAPMNFSMFWQALPFAWLFGVYIKDRWPGWWAKYALIMSSALGVGIALSTLVQFFALTNRDVQFPDWWGTTQYTSTCDFQDCRWLTLGPNQTFGPTEWH